MCTFFVGDFMDIKFIDLALNEAKKAFDLNEVPIGAVIVKDGKIISQAYNLKNSSNSIISHAEIIAIQKAEKILNNWRLDGCDIYVTLDPCPMCASAIKQARIDNVYSCLSNSDSNYNEIIESIFKYNDSTNNCVNFVSNLKIDESKRLLSTFFENKRK